MTMIAIVMMKKSATVINQNACETIFIVGNEENIVRLIRMYMERENFQKGGAGKGVGLGWPIARPIVLAHQ